MNIEERNKLVEDHLNLVEIIAKFYSKKIPAFVDLKDLISEGSIGLIRAASRYDKNSKYTFKSFARHHILGSMKDYLRSIDITSRTTRLRINNINKIRIEYLNKYGTEPSDEKLSLVTGFKIHLIYRYKILSEFKADHLDSRSKIISNNKNPEEIAIEKQLNKYNLEVLDKALKTLSLKEKTILFYYYYQNVSMEKIANSLNLHPSRISQMHKSILMKLKVSMVVSKLEDSENYSKKEKYENTYINASV